MNNTDSEREALARALRAWVEHARGGGLAYVPPDDRAVASANVANRSESPPVQPRGEVSGEARVEVEARVGVEGAARSPSEADRGPAQQRSGDLRRSAATWSPTQKLEYLRMRSIGDCRRCGLCRSRSNIVFGVGSSQAEIMFVGEAPGAEEDRRGEPFVGRAGQRLDRWLQELGLSRPQVYIANVLKCRPPGNRDPRPEEVERCAPFLQAQIRAIAPKVLVALGRHAGMLLSRRDDLSLRAMRTATLDYDASARDEVTRTRVIPLIVTYHPAYVLRQERGTEHWAPVNDAVLSDLRRALQIVAGSG